MVDDAGKPKQLPWEDWREGEDADTSGWVRATAPSGDASFEGVVQWSGELGYGVRAAEPTQAERDAPDSFVEPTGSAGDRIHEAHDDDHAGSDGSDHGAGH